MKPIEPTFEQFFDAYSKAYGARRDKKRAEGPWKRLSAKNKIAAYEGIEKYKEICSQDKRSMCYAQGYLSGERWNDSPLSGEGEEKETKNKALQQMTIDFSSPQLPQGTRLPTEEELRQLSAFKQALVDAPTAKPYLRERYQTDIVRHLSIPYVNERTGIMHLCIDRDGKLERITEFMIDYYDSYDAFFRKLKKHFDTTKLTFQTLE